MYGLLSYLEKKQPQTSKNITIIYRLKEYTQKVIGTLFLNIQTIRFKLIWNSVRPSARKQVIVLIMIRLLGANGFLSR